MAIVLTRHIVHALMRHDLTSQMEELQLHDHIFARLTSMTCIITSLKLLQCIGHYITEEAYGDSQDKVPSKHIIHPDQDVCYLDILASTS